MSGTVLQVSHLIKQYKSAVSPAVDDISFAVGEGELFCLLGVNGAGKSTTINILCTLLDKTAGTVSVDNLVLGEDDEQIRHRIGVVFQGGVLDGVLTVRENLLLRAAFYGLTPQKARQRIENLAGRLSMQEFLSGRYERLSGGQRRKCDIARALLARPRILFLDEPTTGLDPQSRIDLWKTIDEIRREEGMTVFLTTHYMEETEQADRVAIMDHGKILCLDTPQRLKSLYSSDTLRLIVKEGCRASLEPLLPAYTVTADTYVIRMKNGLDAVELLTKVKPYLHSFEMEKGNMDSVFLNVVGRDGTCVSGIA